MLRIVIFSCLFAASLTAAIWPDHLGKFERKSVQAGTVPDRTLADELGFEETESASYGAFRVTASRYKDSTDAYAASLDLPGSPKQLGNYVITCSGACPKNWMNLAESLPGLRRGSPPLLRNYLPAKAIVAGSERYILGPAALKAAAPSIPESAIGFQFGPEGALAQYRTPGGETTLAVFSYPTMEMAREQATALQKLPGIAVKRSGPLVAFVLTPKSDPATDQLLSQINYQAVVSSDDQQLPLVLKPQTAGQMILAIIALAGIVLGFCLLSGIAFGAVRIAARRFGYSDAGTPYTTLHLSDKITPPISPR